MNKKEVYEMGFDRGRNFASWVDVPEIGSRVPKDVDWVGYDIVTEENVKDVMELYASANEENDRQYSPFESTAHDFNEARNSDSLWEAFDRGISDGIRKEIKSRFSKR